MQIELLMSLDDTHYPPLISNCGTFVVSSRLLKATVPLVYTEPTRAMLTIDLPSACCCLR